MSEGEVSRLLAVVERQVRARIEAEDDARALWAALKEVEFCLCGDCPECTQGIKEHAKTCTLAARLARFAEKYGRPV